MQIWLQWFVYEPWFLKPRHLNNVHLIQPITYFFSITESDYTEVAEVIANYSKAGIPLETM